MKFYRRVIKFPRRKTIPYRGAKKNFRADKFLFRADKNFNAMPHEIKPQ